MKKIVRIGSRRTWGGRWYSIYLKITDEDGYLSITGVEGPCAGGNCIGGCGQIRMTLRPSDIERWAPGWSLDLANKVWDIWDTWHLMLIGNFSDSVPASVIEFLAGLPDTDRQPAWT
jgi:hypothetical protein